MLLPLIVPVGVVQSLTYHPVGTETLATLGPLSFSQARAVRGASVGAQLATMALSIMLFSMTTTPNDVGLALYHSGVPYRYAYLATMGLRFLPLMQSDLQTLQDARAVRGDPNAGSENPLRRAMGLPKSMFPLAATSLRQSGEIATALELRGYGAAEGRTIVSDLNMRPTDCVVAGLAVVGVVAVIYARFVAGIGGS